MFRREKTALRKHNDHTGKAALPSYKVRFLFFILPNGLIVPLLAHQPMNLEAEARWYNSTNIYWHLLPLQNDAGAIGLHKGG